MGGGEGGELERGREAARRAAWAEAHGSLTSADQSDRSAPLDGSDLELLATAAYLLGRTQDYLRALQRAQQWYAERGNPRRAARCAFWLAFHLLDRGEVAQASGWLAGAGRLLEHEPPDCAEHGYLLLPVGLGQDDAGDYTGAQDTLARAAAIGRRAGEADLVALGAARIAARTALRCAARPRCPAAPARRRSAGRWRGSPRHPVAAPPVSRRR